MNRFDLATFLLDLTTACEGWNAFQIGSSAAIALLLTLLIHRERKHRRHIQSLLAETLAEKPDLEEATEKIALRQQVEGDFIKSEERYRAFIEQSSEGIWCFEAEPPIDINTPEDKQIELIRQNCRLVECNDSFVKMYGFTSPEELIGTRCNDLLMDPDPHNWEYLRSFIRSGYRFTDAESHEVDCSGQLKYILNNCIGIVQDGYLVRLWGTQRDITDRKRAEEALRHSEEQLQLALKASNMGIWDWDLVNDRITWSQGHEQLFGMAHDSFNGTYAAFEACVHPDDRETIVQMVYQSLKQRQDFFAEFRVIWSDGTIHWIEGKGRFFYNATDEAVRMLGTVADISDRKQAEAERKAAEDALRESQQLIEQMTTSTTAVLYIYDLMEERNVYVNPQVTEVLGYSLEAIQAMGSHLFTKLIHPDDLLQRLEGIEQLRHAEANGVVTLEYRVLHANGEWRWLQSRDRVFKRTVAGDLQSVIGSAIDISDRKQVEAVLRSRNRELSTLHQISEITLRNLSPKAVFQGVVEEISTATGFPIVAIELYDEARQMMVFEGVKGLPECDQSLEVPVHQTLSGTVATTGKAIIKHYAEQEAKHCDANQVLKQLGIQTFICLPMIVNQHIIGVLSLAHPEVMQTNEDTLRWIEGLTNYLALVTHRTQLEASVQQANVELGQRVAEQTAELREANAKLTGWVSDLEQRHQEITLLNEISDLMQACFTLDEAYTVISQFMPRLFPGCSGAVYMIRESQSLVEAIATWGETHQPIASQILFTPTECFALRRGQPHYVEASHHSLCCKHLVHPYPVNYFCVPMVAQGEASGVLYLNASHQPLSQAKQQLATTVARQIALAIANLKLYTTLQNQSIRDPLTGLYNRRYLDDFLERELRRAERNQHALCILLMDVDHFKVLNDTFGHDAGDAVLQQLSRFLQAQIRSSDIACRYGGEEMVLILPETCLEDAMQRAEQLRHGIKNLSVEHSQPLRSVTVSIGVSCFPAHASSSGGLLQAADLALYQAKAAGRDRIAMADQASAGET